MRKTRAIILDWAGTTVDYGSFAPVDAFITAFAHFGVTPTIEETRAPMGLQKRAHIEKMLSGARLAAAWREAHGREWSQADVDGVYAQFEPALFDVLPGHAEPLPGVIETVSRIRAMKIAIGSTTGYTRAMMDVVEPLARDNGYAPDTLVCPDRTGGMGRPYPYMLWRNLEKLGILSIDEALKIGDTAADMAEGRNAGCRSVGVLRGSNIMGLTEAEAAAKSADEMRALLGAARTAFKDAGADYVIEDITELPALIEALASGQGAERYA